MILTKMPTTLIRIMFMRPSMHRRNVRWNAARTSFYMIPDCSMRCGMIRVTGCDVMTCQLGGSIANTATNKKNDAEHVAMPD